MRHSLRAVSLWWLIVLVPITGAAATNKAPKAKKDAATTVAGKSVLIPVTANDRDPDGRIDRKTVELVGRDPLGGTARVKRRNGKVIYTPDPDFSGQDTFKYRFKDNRGAWSNKARVTVTVAVGPVVITSLQEDSGTNKSDFITNDFTPTLIGAAATDIIEVTLYENDTPVLPAAGVNRNGTWSYTYPLPGLDDDVYTFTATGTNAFGQESSPSAAQIVMVDTTGPSEPDLNQRGGCDVNENALPGLVPQLFSLHSCLVLGFPDRGVPARAVVQQVDSEFDLNKIGPIYTYRVKDGFSDGFLRMDITDPLPSGTYHLTFVVSDVAGNESCVESKLFPPPENTGCTESGAFLYVSPRST